MKLTYVIMTNEEVIGKVYQHPILGRTICFEGKVKMDDKVQIWKMEEDGQHTKITDKLVLELFRDMLPI